MNDYEFGDGYQQIKDPGFVFDPNDPRDYATQYYAWGLIKDTLVYDISTYPGSGDQQFTQPQPPVVRTKPTAGELCRRMRRGR